MLGAAARLISKQGIPEQASWGCTPALTQPLTKWWDVLEGITVLFGPPTVCNKETIIIRTNAAAFGAMALCPLCTLLRMRAGAAAPG